MPISEEENIKLLAMALTKRTLEERLERRLMGWRSRDYAEAIADGLVDKDLESMMVTISERIKHRDGLRYCPDCGELLEGEHEHDGYRVVPISRK